MDYILLRTGELIAALSFALLCIQTAVLLFRCNRKYMPVDILRGFHFSAVRGKVFVVLSALMLTGVLVLVSAEQNRQSASLSLVLTYPEASSGRNPSGTRYNMSDILSQEVLEDAIAYGGFENVTADDLLEGLDVYPVGGSVGDAMVTTQFVLSFHSGPETSGIPASDVVYAVAGAYKNWFIEKYSPNYAALDITFEDRAEFDYPDWERYFSDKIQIICNFSDYFRQKDNSFISSATGETFGSINEKGWNIHNTGMESLNSYILANGLSRDKASYLSRLRYDYTNWCNTYRNNIQSYDVRIEAIEKYDNDMATVVYIPTYDTDNTFYMSKTKIGIDHFSADANEYSADASEVLANILDVRYLLLQLRAQESPASAYDRAEEMAVSLEKQIRDLAEVTVKTAQEYTDVTANGYISITGFEKSLSDRYGRALVLGVLFLVIAYVNRALASVDRKTEWKKRGGDDE